MAAARRLRRPAVDVERPAELRRPHRTRGRPRVDRAATSRRRSPSDRPPVGLGLTMEAIHNNPAFFELIADRAWEPNRPASTRGSASSAGSVTATRPGVAGVAAARRVGAERDEPVDLSRVVHRIAVPLRTTTAHARRRRSTTTCGRPCTTTRPTWCAADHGTDPGAGGPATTSRWRASPCCCGSRPPVQRPALVDPERTRGPRHGSWRCSTTSTPWRRPGPPLRLDTWVAAARRWAADDDGAAGAGGQRPPPRDGVEHAGEPVAGRLLRADLGRACRRLPQAAMGTVGAVPAARHSSRTAATAPRPRWTRRTPHPRGGVHRERP